jgi:beta-carotene hydroxylase
MKSVAPEYELRRERAVARKYIGRIQWEMLLVGFGQFLVWLTTLVLGINGVISLWVGFPIAVLCCCLAYLPSHEAQHGNIAGRHEHLTWLNNMLGHVSLANLGFPYAYARTTHMKHHAFTNQPERDPDHHYMGKYWWHSALEVHRNPPSEVLERLAAEDSVFQKDLLKGLVTKKFYSFAMLAAAVAWPLPTLILWWIPQKIGLSYITIFFAWVPHNPGIETERYRASRFWKTRLLPRYFVQSMTHHAVHHLYPRIPHWSQPDALRELKPFIDAREMYGAELIPLDRRV